MTVADGRPRPGLGRGDHGACSRRCCSSRAAEARVIRLRRPRRHDRRTATAATTTSTTLPDVAPTPADFVNINTMTRVGDHFVGSLNGHLAAALAVARSAQGRCVPGRHRAPAVPHRGDGQAPQGIQPGDPRLGVLLAEGLAAGHTIASSGDEGEELPRSRLRVVPRAAADRGSTSCAGRPTVARRSRSPTRSSPALQSRRPPPEATEPSGADHFACPTRSRPCRRACAGSRRPRTSARGTL